MALESASWVTQLVDTNPVVGDPVGEGDDHLRMLKTVLKNSFPSTSTTAIVPNVSGQSGKFLSNDGTDSSWEAVQGGQITTQLETFSNYDAISGTGTTTIAGGNNGFLCGPITVNSGVTWTISGTLNIL